MHYIVFDLEWNQCPEGKAKEVEGLPFEIVEIGAVKLNEDRDIIGSYHEVVRPVVYKKMHAVTSEIINMKSSDLKKGRTFVQVFQSFFKWCGKNYKFCTWGCSDLIELQRNMKYFGISRFLKGPIYFYDLQKIFSIALEDGKSRRSLEYAVDFLKIKKDVPFHRAIADAFYTAKLFQQLPEDVIQKNYSIDYYRNPKNRREEILEIYEDHAKFISREFRNKEEAMNDKNVRAIFCHKCSADVVKVIPWFSANAKLHCCLGFCEEHGYISGKIRMKRTDRDKIFCVKSLKLVDEEEAQKLKEKQEAIKLKRRIKRNEKTEEKVT